jgi:hypothetical protein
MHTVVMPIIIYQSPENIKQWAQKAAAGRLKPDNNAARKDWLFFIRDRLVSKFWGIQRNVRFDAWSEIMEDSEFGAMTRALFPDEHSDEPFFWGHINEAKKQFDQKHEEQERAEEAPIKELIAKTAKTFEKQAAEWHNEQIERKFEAAEKHAKYLRKHPESAPKYPEFHWPRHIKCKEDAYEFMQPHCDDETGECTDAPEVKYGTEQIYAWYDALESKRPPEWVRLMENEEAMRNMATTECMGIEEFKRHYMVMKQNECVPGLPSGLLKTNPELYGTESKRVHQERIKYGKATGRWHRDILPHEKGKHGKPKPPSKALIKQVEKELMDEYDLDDDDDVVIPRVEHKDVQEKPIEVTAKAIIAKEAPTETTKSQANRYIKDLLSGACGQYPKVVTTSDILDEKQEWGFEKWRIKNDVAKKKDARRFAVRFGAAMTDLLECIGKVHDKKRYDTEKPISQTLKAAIAENKKRKLEDSDALDEPEEKKAKTTSVQEHRDWHEMMMERLKELNKPKDDDLTR